MCLALFPAWLHPAIAQSQDARQIVEKAQKRASQIEKVQDIWTARVLEMNDLRRKSRTVLTLDRLQYNVLLNDEDFTVTGLQRDR